MTINLQGNNFYPRSQGLLEIVGNEREYGRQRGEVMGMINRAFAVAGPGASLSTVQKIIYHQWKDANSDASAYNTMVSAIGVLAREGELIDLRRRHVPTTDELSNGRAYAENAALHVRVEEQPHHDGWQARLAPRRQVTPPAPAPTPAAAPRPHAPAPGAIPASQLDLRANTNSNGYARTELLAPNQQTGSLSAERHAVEVLRRTGRPASANNIMRELAREYHGATSENDKTNIRNAYRVWFRTAEMDRAEANGARGIEKIDTSAEYRTFFGRADASLNNRVTALAAPAPTRAPVRNRDRDDDDAPTPRNTSRNRPATGNDNTPSTSAPALGSTQASAITSTQAPALTSTQAPAISSTQAPALTSTQVPAISSTQAPALTSTQAPAISSTQAPALTSTQAPALTSTQVATLNSTQIAALDNSQIAALGSTQLAALNSTQIAALNSTQIAALSSTQVASLSSTQISGLNTTQTAALTADPQPPALGSSTAARPLNPVSTDRNVNRIRQAQLFLEELGINTGNRNHAAYAAGGRALESMDGINGTLTRPAIIAFQRDHNLPQTGVVDIPTLNALEVAVVAHRNQNPQRGNDTAVGGNSTTVGGNTANIPPRPVPFSSDIEGMPEDEYQAGIRPLTAGGNATIPPRPVPFTSDITGMPDDEFRAGTAPLTLGGNTNGVAGNNTPTGGNNDIVVTAGSYRPGSLTLGNNFNPAIGTRLPDLNADGTLNLSPFRPSILNGLGTPSLNADGTLNLNNPLGLNRVNPLGNTSVNLTGLNLSNSISYNPDTITSSALLSGNSLNLTNLSQLNLTPVNLTNVQNQSQEAQGGLPDESIGNGKGTSVGPI